jgi:hypothetical protein
VVSAFTAVPGVLIRIAGIEPPYIEEPYTPRRTVKPTIGSMENVAGNRIAIATGGPTPGIAPIKTPPTDPVNSARKTSHLDKISIAENNKSIMSSKI